MTLIGNGPFSPAFPLHDALYTVITTDDVTSLAELLAGRVYSLRAPEGSALPYIVLGSTYEVEFRRLMSEGATTEIEMHIYSEAAEAASPVLQIYGMLRQIFHRTRLTLDEHKHMTGTVELLDVIGDPVGSHGIVRYRAQTRPKRQGEA